MKNHFIALLLFILSASAIQSSARSEWKAYMAYHHATFCQSIKGIVYTLADGSLFTYQYGDTQVKTFSKSTGLGDCNITHMAFNEKEQAFLLVYDNFNIDVLGINDSISHMTEYKNSNISDKTVNDIFMEGDYAYLSTNSGIIEIDMKHRQFNNTYNFGVAVKSCARLENQILAFASSGIWSGNIKNNLIDASNWKHLGTHVFDRVFVQSGKLYGRENKGICSIDPESGRYKMEQEGNYTYWSSSDGISLLGDTSKIVSIDDAGKFHVVKCPNDFRYLTFDGEYYWACLNAEGLQAYMLQGDTLKEASAIIVPNSPMRNLCYYLNYTPDGKLLVGGGSLNYTNNNYEGTVMSYKNGRWTNFQEQGIAKATQTYYWNITSVAEDPEDSTHHYASAACGGLYEFYDGVFNRLYTNDNSPLTSILADDATVSTYKKREFVRISGLTYDESGNLWMLNNQVDTILHVLKTDGSWQGFYFPQLAGYPTFDKILIDSRGIMWITHRRTTASHEAGVLGFYHGNTLSDTSDDEWNFLSTFTNQDNTSYTFNQVYDVTEDLDHHIWIGTDKGPFVLKDPVSFFDGIPQFTQIKVPRNDGTDYADYLLSGISITCIAIDGGNRKWFGTSEDGVYLISADGMNTIHHFTMQNSPLLSNTVYSLAINGKTGEVMIGTAAGLVSYRSDATDAVEPLAKGNLKIYPNPVRPQFTGNLRIDGLSYDSDVKITTATGQLIAQGQSIGGTFTWNLRNKDGNRVATGVYHVIASNQSGEKGVVGKFLVIK